MTAHSTSPDLAAHAALERLVSLIQIEPTGEGDGFRGQSEDIGTPAVFGGQVLGQALMAASLTAPAGRSVHSFHAYFLLPGRHELIDYTVGRVRDGGSFSTRRVEARQQGATIFELLASYQEQEGVIDRHDPMPPVPGPEGITNEIEYRLRATGPLPDVPALCCGAIYTRDGRLVASTMQEGLMRVVSR